MPDAIPYEKQDDPLVKRGCGAAALSMVYRSFGLEWAQGEIWPLISKKNKFGSVASTTHLMALHALSQNFKALIVQARHPIQVLRLCHQNGIRAILNHRPQPEAANGHYTVLAGIDDKTVTIHDPALGPSRRISHDALLKLWLPLSPESEIAGNVIIGIAKNPGLVPACEFCHTAVPSTIRCPKCQRRINLEPAALLGCARDGCIARLWNYIACPGCDYMWAFDEAGTSTREFTATATTRKSPAAKREPPKLDELFAGIDKFCAGLQQIPGALKHPDIQTQLRFIEASKVALQTVRTQEIGMKKAHREKIEAFTRVSKKKIEAEQKRQEELNAPPEPLDGEALKQALLKNLGFK